MNKHKKFFEAEYLVFARKWRPVVMFLSLLIVCTVNFFISGVFWQIAVLTGPLLSVAILCFMDYFVFAGFNSRKSIGMDLMKSSVKGGALVEAALKQDIVNKSIYVLTASTAALVSIFIFNEDIDHPFVIAYTIAAFSSCQVLLRISLLIDRAKGLTMQVHIFIFYLCYSVGSLILIPLIFISENINLPLMIGYAVIAETGSVLTGIWLIRSCMKAYDASMHDASEDKSQA